MKTLILGVGNTLLGDEGVGVVALARLSERIGDRPDLELVDGGTLSFTLAVPIADADALIVFDAATIAGPAGSVALFEGGAMDAFIGAQRKSSVHEVGLADLMAIARLTDAWPTHRALVGIRPARVGWGASLTPAVERGVETMCERAIELLNRWNVAPASAG